MQIVVVVVAVVIGVVVIALWGGARGGFLALTVTDLSDKISPF